MSLRRFHHALREWLYGPGEPMPEDVVTPATLTPPRLREATHRLNNELTSLDATFHDLRRNYDDPLEELVRRITAGRNDGSAIH